MKVLTHTLFNVPPSAEIIQDAEALQLVENEAHGQASTHTRGVCSPTSYTWKNITLYPEPILQPVRPSAKKKKIPAKTINQRSTPYDKC